MAQPSEATIRDQLAQNLSIIEQGLVLVDIEKYIPHPSGTRGFIDLLARDVHGRHVLIELKRSDAAARQALHEAFKYIEGVKINLAARDDELRVLIISTEWKELLIPFSAAVAHVRLDVEGYELVVDGLGKPIRATRVTPLSLQGDRLFSPWHELALYTTQQSLEAGIESYENCCAKKDIQDYVLLVLRAPAGHREREVEGTLARLNAILPPERHVTREEVAAKLPQHDWMLYFGPLQLRDEELLSRLKALCSHEEFEDVEESLSEMTGDERTCSLQENLLAHEPVPDRDYIEIAYPAKLTRRLNEDGWHLDRVLRFGKIRLNSVLTDETILAELQGEQGVTGQRYVKEIQGRPSVAQLSTIREELKECLAHNPIWGGHLQIAMDELVAAPPDSTTRISVYNPNNSLLTIYLALSRDDGILFIPNYHVTTTGPDGTQMIYGVLSGDGSKPSMKAILEKHFSGEFWNMLMPLNWGGYFHEDRFVARDAGLKYRTFKLIVSVDGGRTPFELTELGWEGRDEAPKPFQYFEQYIEANEDFVADVLTIFSTHWDGSMISFDDNDPPLELRT